MTTTTHPEPGKTCVCADPQVDRLRDMVTAGWDQVEASRVLWGDPQFAALSQPARLVVAGDAARATVRQALQRAFPWLRPREG